MKPLFRHKVFAFIVVLGILAIPVVSAAKHWGWV